MTDGGRRDATALDRAEGEAAAAAKSMKTRKRIRLALNGLATIPGSGGSDEHDRHI
jgi:hypothetical protein